MDNRVVEVELRWITRRIAQLVWHGMPREDAIAQAVDEQMAMEEFGLDREIRRHVRGKRA